MSSILLINFWKLSNMKIKNHIPLLGKVLLFLFAIKPIIEKIDLIFYVFCLSIIVLFSISTIGLIQRYKDSREKFLICLYGTRHDALYDCIISILGILSYYLVYHSFSGTGIWWCLLVTTIVWPLPKRINKRV